MKTIQYNTIFTNVAHTEDGHVYWEGLDDTMVAEGQSLISWKGKKWTKDSTEPAAHPNSRFCAPAENCPTIDANWESPEGVPISAIIFGGRRPQGVPLVYEAFNWEHGVFVGSAMRSEATAAAEHKAKVCHRLYVPLYISVELIDYMLIGYYARSVCYETVFRI